MKKMIYFVLFAWSITAFATPREIVIIRHADRAEKKMAGQFLIAKGQVRAEKFAAYFLTHFGTPDFLFASNPLKSDKTEESKSFRPVQTLAPLANQLSLKTKSNVLVFTPYFYKEYAQLTSDLLKDKQFDNKLIVICWQHFYLNDIAKKLGVTVSLKKWGVDVYDTVYILKYNIHGKLDSFQLLKHQYPVNGRPDWKKLTDQY